jgi:uncharacterized membrane protein
MEPAFGEGGALVPAFGWLVGSGAGAGIGFIMVISAIAVVIVMVVAYSTPTIRNAETLLPDHDAQPKDEPIAAT